MNKKTKLLSSIGILILTIVMFVVMFFSFGVISFKEKEIYSYNNNYNFISDKSEAKELGWTLNQLSVSDDSANGSASFGSTGVIVTDPEENDYLYMWGSNSFGQLGNGTTQTTFKPTLVDFGDMEYSDIKYFSMGTSHSMAVLTDESGHDLLYGWGNNAYSQLGFDTDIYSSVITTPTLITTLPEYDEIKQLSTGADQSAVILVDYDGIDSLYTTGKNFNGSLGVGEDFIITEMTLVEFPDRVTEIKSVDLSYTNTIVVTTNYSDGKDSLYMSGDNKYNQINNSSINTFYEPVYVELPINYNEIKQVKSGWYHVMVLLVDTKGNDVLYSWGANDKGQTGVGSSDSLITAPTLVKFDDEYSEIKYIDAQFALSAAITVDSEGNEHIYMWGDNRHGMIGNNINYNPSTPYELEVKIIGNYNIKEFSLGGHHVGMIIKSENKGSDILYLWGNNSTGQSNQDTTILNVDTMTSYDETPIITFGANQPATIYNEENGNKYIQFTLLWNSLSVSPDKIELIDSDGLTISEIYGIENISQVQGIKTTIDISNFSAVSNVRIKISDKDKILLISESFDILENPSVHFSSSPISNYYWMTTEKNIIFTLNYYSNDPLVSVEIINADTKSNLDIDINVERIKSGEEYIISITELENPKKIDAYLEVVTVSGHSKSENFTIPSTKLDGSFVILIVLIVLILSLIVILFILILMIKYKIEKDQWIRRNNVGK